jgi:hypothetical protein
MDGEYIPNPDAENVQNHQLGYGYWLRQLSGKTDEWIKVYVLGQYGTVHDGKPVYPEYNDAIHARTLTPMRGVMLRIGFDFGLMPAAVITQTDARGRLLVIDELCGEDMAIRRFLQDILIPHLMTIYPEWWDKKADQILCFGDPAGNQRAQTNEKTCFQEIELTGLRMNPYPKDKSNNFLPRRDAVAWFLSKLSGGQPAFLIDGTACPVLRKGFNGGYKYRRIRVTGEERYTDDPVGNVYSHPHDALQYVALEVGGVQSQKPKAPDLPRITPYRPSRSTAGAMG